MLRDELRLLEISVWLENLDTLKAGARKLEADFHAAESQRDEARAALDALYAEGERYSERMREKDMEAERVRTESAVLEEQIKEKESAAAVLESTVTHNRENIQRAEAELAEAVDVTRQTIISLESGRYNASLLLAHRIARYFDLTIEAVFLFDGDE